MIKLFNNELKDTETISFNELNGDTIKVYDLSIDGRYRYKRAVKGMSYIHRTDSFGGTNPFNALLDPDYVRERAYISYGEMHKASYGLEIQDDKHANKEIPGILKRYYDRIRSFRRFQNSQKLQYCRGKLNSPSVEVSYSHVNSYPTREDRSEYYLITTKSTKEDKFMAGIVHFDRGAHLAQLLERGEYKLLADTMHGQDEWDKIRPHYNVRNPRILQRKDLPYYEWQREVKKAEKDKDVIEYIKRFK